MKMTDQEFQRIAKYMKSKYGIDMFRKREIIHGRLDNYVSQGPWESFTEYMNQVENDPSGKLERKLVSILSTNHTYFMREFEHMEYLRGVIIPELKQKLATTRDIHIWCGASSTGEEPYILAMLLQEAFGLEAQKWDTTVLATDISTEVLQTAQKGIYSMEQIEPLPDSWKRRFFRRIPGEDYYQATEELRSQVLFRKLNLMEPFPFKKKMHVIFLRNVMIYFDQETKNRLIKKVYDCLEPGGYLFIGKTETIDRSVAPFQMIKPSVFRKK